MRAIRVIVATICYLIGIVIFSIVTMFFVFYAVDTLGGRMNWDDVVYGCYIILISAICIILLAIVISCFDSLLIYFLKARKPCINEQELLKKLCVQDVLDKTEVKIKNVLIVNNNNINAYALGNETVVFTTGLLKVDFSGENVNMLYGIAVHEAGHIHEKDTKIYRIIYAFSSIGILIGWFACRFADVARECCESNPLVSIAASIICCILLALKFLYRCLIMIGNIIMRVVSRDAEFKADKYAYNLGYGKGAKKLLCKISKVENKDNIVRRLLPTLSRLFDTHPAIEKRIKALEDLGC